MSNKKRCNNNFKSPDSWTPYIVTYKMSKITSAKDEVFWSEKQQRLWFGVGVLGPSVRNSCLRLVRGSPPSHDANLSMSCILGFVWWKQSVSTFPFLNEFSELGSSKNGEFSMWMSWEKRNAVVISYRFWTAEWAIIILYLQNNDRCVAYNKWVFWPMFSISDSNNVEKNWNQLECTNLQSICLFWKWPTKTLKKNMNPIKKFQSSILTVEPFEIAQFLTISNMISIKSLWTSEISSNVYSKRSIDYEFHIGQNIMQFEVKLPEDKILLFKLYKLYIHKFLWMSST